jgi:cyanophycinase
MWQSINANHGDFVVIRASGDDAYNEWIMEMSVAAGVKLNSVRTILFRNRDASSEPEVLDVLRKSEAIFMAGGDQSVYLDYWMDSEVQSIVQEKSQNITIGGTSAGCAVLGNWVYSGEIDSVSSDQVSSVACSLIEV